MANFLRLALLAALVATASAAISDDGSTVSPLDKVITLIRNLKEEVEGEGTQEATTYKEFACFCKTKTESLSSSIKTNQDDIDTLSAKLEENTATKEDKITQKAEQKARKERQMIELKEAEVRCSKAQAEYEAHVADMSKAVNSLEDAIKSMEDSKPAMMSVRSTVKKNLALAEAWQLIDHSTLRAFLQEDSKVDPSDPDFKYHSQDIISLLKKMLSEFSGKKSKADTEWASTKSTCTSEQSALSEGIDLSGKAVGSLVEGIERLEVSLGSDRGSLVQTDAELKDNKKYLEDLTKMCEQRAKDWDQRSSARGDEISALGKALTVLMDDASGVESVNERALLLQQKQPQQQQQPQLPQAQQQKTQQQQQQQPQQQSQQKTQQQQQPQQPQQQQQQQPQQQQQQQQQQQKSKSLPVETAPRAAKTVAKPSASAGAGPSFLQQQQVRLGRQIRGAEAAVAVPVVKHVQASAVQVSQSASAKVAVASRTSQEARKQQALAALREAGGRLGSSALAAVATKAAADPFEKVKGLIQGLIERLLSEATQEATKKSFCDTKVSKANQDRDFRFADVSRYTTEISGLEAKEDLLTFEIKELKKDIKQLTTDLEEAARIRKEEHDENLETIRKAKQGKKAVSSAMDILAVFYKQSAKAASLVQTEASPVDEDTSGAGFQGSYKGKQTASEGIVGILQVLESDFERTAKVTLEGEDAARAKFVEFERASKSDISGKSTTQTRDEEELEMTKGTKETKMTDLQTAMDLVDGSLKQLEGLKPMCIDSGMSYDDRVSKREEEIKALKSAVCMLDEDGVEPECT